MEGEGDVRSAVMKELDEEVIEVYGAVVTEIGRTSLPRLIVRMTRRQWEEGVEVPRLGPMEWGLVHPTFYDRK